MKTKLYIVSYVSFDGYDDNLYTEVKTFTDRDKAEAFYRQSVDTARADARREEDSDDEDNWTPISENESDGEYNVSRDNDERYFTRVELIEQEIESRHDRAAKCKLGDTVTGDMDDDGKQYTGIVTAIHLRFENDTDGSPLDNSIYRIRYEKDGKPARVWLYESELTHINGQPVNFK
jgi:hypothetical protein